MAYFKGIDLILLLPMMVFFIEGNIKYGFALVPSFWTFSLFYKSMESGSNYPFFFAGLVFYGMVISLFFFQFKKRVFDR
jgi:fluoroquinolone transport system permease protein